MDVRYSMLTLVADERIEISPSSVNFGALKVGYIYASTISMKNHGKELVKFSVQKPDTSFISFECKNMTVWINGSPRLRLIIH